jgi:hypothetical protein
MAMELSIILPVVEEELATVRRYGLRRVNSLHEDVQLDEALLLVLSVWHGVDWSGGAARVLWGRSMVVSLSVSVR